MDKILPGVRPVTTGGLMETNHVEDHTMMQITRSQTTFDRVTGADSDGESTEFHPLDSDPDLTQYTGDRSQSQRTPLPTQPARSLLRRTPSAARSSLREPNEGSHLVTQWVRGRVSGRRRQLHVNDERYDQSDSDYDTDLEEEGILYSANEDREYITYRNLYMKTCKMYGVVPMAYFLRHMDEPKLEVKHHCLGPNGFKALAVPLQINTHITSLNLEGNWIGSEGTKHLAYMLGENTYINSLNVAWNGLGSKGAKLLCESLHTNRNIKALDLSGNGFQDRDAACIASLMQNNTAIIELSLSNNSFSETGALQLGKAIGLNENIEKLDLSWNHIRLKGADAIARGLKNNNSITVLNLSMNGFGASGAASLAAALLNNTCLQELDISNNRIDAEGCKTLGRMLAKNSTITLLEMGLNPVSFAGALSLVGAIQSNSDSALQYLDLTGAVVNEDFMLSVREIQEDRQFDVYVSYVSKSKDVEKGDTLDVTDKNPLEILLIFMSEKKLRLVDLFKSLDKDQSGSLERSEFIEGLQSVDTPLTEAQLDELIKMLDKDGDGEIDISEIMNINKEFKDIKKKAAKKAQEKMAAAAKSKLKAALNTVKVVQAFANGSLES